MRLGEELLLAFMFDEESNGGKRSFHEHTLPKAGFTQGEDEPSCTEVEQTGQREAGKHVEAPGQVGPEQVMSFLEHSRGQFPLITNPDQSRGQARLDGIKGDGCWLLCRMEILGELGASLLA